MMRAVMTHHPRLIPNAVWRDARIRWPASRTSAARSASAPIAPRRRSTCIARRTDVDNLTTTPIVNVPYTQECNDVAMMLIQHHKASEYYDRAIDQFEQIYQDSADSARTMALVVHPYIMGAPHRLKHFRRIFETIKQKPGVAFMTGEQILDWYLSVGPKAP